MHQNISVIVGTYEELVLGYSLVFNKEEHEFKTVFTDHSHTASVRSVAVSCNGIAATGSADESIKLFDFNKRVEIGSLLHHQGSVTGLQFFKKSHLFSCSVDGTIAIWHVGTWECLRTLKGHKTAVNSLSVHPSGKLALSCGIDKTLRTWNLITGRCAFIINLKQAADTVLWSHTGNRYVVVANNVVDVYLSETATIKCTLNVPNKISSALFLSDTLLAVGCEKGLVLVYDVSVGVPNVCSISTGTNRVKSMSVINTDLKSMVSLVLASSDGFIKVYQLNIEDAKSVSATLMAEFDTGFRLLCVAVHSGDTLLEDTNSEVVSEKQDRRISPHDERDERQHKQKSAVKKKKMQKVKDSKLMNKVKDSKSTNKVKDNSKLMNKQHKATLDKSSSDKMNSSSNSRKRKRTN